MKKIILILPILLIVLSIYIGYVIGYDKGNSTLLCPICKEYLSNEDVDKLNQKEHPKIINDVEDYKNKALYRQYKLIKDYEVNGMILKSGMICSLHYWISNMSGNEYFNLDCPNDFEIEDQELINEYFRPRI